MKVLKKLPLRVALLPLLLLGLLSSCAVYDTVFHPHRLPTPKMDAAAKAKYRAAEKARHKGLSLKAPEPSTNATDTGSGGGDPAAPAAAPGGTDDKKKTLTYGELPEGTRVKYDKQGLVRKSMLDRMANNGHKLHHYDTRPLTPREASRDNRKIRKKGHTDHSREAAPREKAPREPLDPALDTGPDPGAPATTPNAPAEEPAKAKKIAGKKALRPVPTRPAPKPVQPKKKTPKAAPTQPAPTPEPTKERKKADKKAPIPKPDPTQPTPAPEPAPPKKKASKVPIPKPDPTQPAPN